MDELGIIAGCMNGNKKAQKTLFEHYSKGMLLLCRRYVKDAHIAEDVLLSGFYKFFSSIGRFKYEDEKSVGKWLKKIMINECLLFLRAKKNIAFVAEEAAEEVILNEDVFEKMNASVILQLIKSLPDGYRLVFNMYVIEGYNHREIAEILEITEGASKSQLSKAKVFLQKLLQKQGSFYER
jgi:RNA polymerase sigma factor (sigma-70 family)